MVPGATTHEDRLHRRRPGGPVFRPADEEAGSAPRHHAWSSATSPTTPSAGASCSPTRRWTTCASGTHRPRPQIQQAFNHWDDIELQFKGRTIRTGGHGFVGIGRKKLLNILQARCEALGVKLVFETEVDTDADFPDADLIIASDGINSKIRNQYARRLQARHRHAAQPLHLAGHAQALRRLHLRLREDRARLVPGAHLQVRRQDHDLHRRDARERLEGARPRHGRAGRSRSPSARSSSPTTCRATS